LNRPGPKRIVVADQAFFWLIRRPNSSAFVHLRVWSAEKSERPLEVRIRCDDLWINFPILAIAGEAAHQVFELRPVTPRMVRQVIEDAFQRGWLESRGRTPLRFDWDRNTASDQRLLPWMSLKARSENFDHSSL
jgi:hypothetical protein